MWDTSALSAQDWLLGTQTELFQLWLNLPPHRKLEAPRMQILTPKRRRDAGAESDVEATLRQVEQPKKHSFFASVHPHGGLACLRPVMDF